MAGTSVTEDSYLFSSALDASTPWRPDVITNRFIRLCKDLGIAGVRLHDLRHYVATSLGAAGTPIATISSRLGHRDRATTLNVYSHSLPALDHHAAEVIGALIDSTPRSVLLTERGQLLQASAPERPAARRVVARAATPAGSPAPPSRSRATLRSREGLTPPPRSGRDARACDHRPAAPPAAAWRQAA